MKKLLLGLMMALGLSGVASAAGAGFPLDKAPARTNDMAALQNGAKLFVNYCLSCHSAAFMRYNRLRDIGLTDKQIAENLTFTTDKIGDTMKASIDPKQAKEWFGANPPDLTLVARSRAGAGGSGSDYLYTFLRTFYRDPARPTGWNNKVYPAVGMPHVLWELQKTLPKSDYDNLVADLTGFLVWVAEPVAQTRKQVGVWVLLFLALFFVFAWRLNAAFWKDIK